MSRFTRAACGAMALTLAVFGVPAAALAAPGSPNDSGPSAPPSPAAVEMWVQADGVPRGWTDAHLAQPTWWDAITVERGQVMIPDPDRGPTMSPTNSGARAAMYRDFGPTFGGDVAVGVTWTGVQPYEGTPLLHVNPDDPSFGLGAWHVALFGGFLVGVVGRSPDQLRAIAFVPFAHLDGVRRRIELRSTGSEFSLHLDGAWVGGPWPVPAGLAGSTLHGVALDANQDQARTPNVPILEGPFTVESIEGTVSTAAEAIPDGVASKVSVGVAARVG